MRLGLLFFQGLVRRHPLRFLLICLCTMFCFTGLLGLRWANDSITFSRQQFEAQCGIGDIVLYTEEVMPGALHAMLTKLPGVNRVSEGVISQPIPAQCADGQRRSVRFVSFMTEEVVHPIRTGNGPALSYGYTVGFDPEAVRALTLPSGQTLNVQDVAWMPLFTDVYIDQFIPSTDGDLVEVYVSAEAFAQITGQTTVNYAVLTLTADADPDLVLEHIHTNTDIFVTHAAFAREDGGMAAALELEKLVNQICQFFPWFFWLVGMTFVCVFLTGVAGRSCRSILHLRDQGAHGFCVFWSLCLFGLVATLTGLLAAIPASALLANYVAQTVLKNMGMPYHADFRDLTGLVLCLAGSLLLSAVAAAAGSLSVSRNRPTGKKPLATILLTATSTAAAVCMVASALFVMDSVETVRQEQFVDRYNYDAQVVYENFVPISHLEELQESGLIQTCEPMLLGNSTLIYGNTQKKVNCVALSPTPLLVVRDADGNKLTPEENAIILSQKTAKALGANPGDLIQLQVRYGMRTILATCSVASISQQLSSTVEVVSMDTVEAYLNSSGVMNSAAVQVLPGKLEDFLEFARQQEAVYVVQTGAAGRQRFDSRYAGTQAMMWVILLTGAALGLSVCLLMCFVQWKQNLRRNTILTLLGAHPLKLHGQNLGTRFWSGLAGLVLGLSAAIMFMPAVLDSLSSGRVTYPFVCSGKTLLICCGLHLGYELCCQIMYLLANHLHSSHSEAFKLT